jgi:hypothetical protein
MTSLENAREGSKYDYDVGNTTNEDTNGDGLVSSKSSICNPRTEDWDHVGQESEKQGEGVGELQAPTQSTCGLLRAFRGCSSPISSCGERELHEVGPYLGNTIVGSTFCKLHGAENKRSCGNLVGYPPKRGSFLFRWTRVAGIIYMMLSFNRRLRLAIINLEVFVVYGVADFLDGSKRASTMGFSKLRGNAGRKHGWVSGVVVSYNGALVFWVRFTDGSTNPS